MRGTGLVCMVVMLAGVRVGNLTAQSAADSAGVLEASLHYLEGWFTGDQERMTQALHPELTKEIVGPDGEIETQGVAGLVEMTGMMKGNAAGSIDLSEDVEILTMFEASASVRIDTPQWIDLLHLVKVDGEWRILHVLWDLRG